MKPEIKEQWVAALRSGKYQQTRGYLRDSKGYCCLGVLTDLYVKQNGREWSKWDGSDVDGTDVYVIDDQDMNLPMSVVQWAGFPTDDPGVTTPEGIESEHGDNVALTELNDGTCTFPAMSFLEIADIIEKEENFV